MWVGGGKGFVWIRWLVVLICVWWYGDWIRRFVLMILFCFLFVDFVEKFFVRVLGDFDDE